MSVFHCPICDKNIDSDFEAIVDLGDELVCEKHLDNVEVAVSIVFHELAKVRKEMRDESLSAPRLDMYLDRMQEILDNHMPVGGA